MKNWGIGLIAIGIIYLIFAINMDVSVEVPTEYVPYVGTIGGLSVANADLMSQRQNHIIIASLLTLVGLILALFGSHQEQRSQTASKSATGPRRQPLAFEGETDLSADGYRLWLAEAYAVERNDVFDKYVLGDRTFESLDDALAEAHARNQAKLGEARLAEEEREQREKKREEEAKIAFKVAEEEWREQRKWFWGCVLALVGSIVFLVWLSL